MPTKTWDGSDGNWRNGGHWTPAGVPQHADNVVIRMGTVHATALKLSTNPIDIGSDQPLNDPTLVLRNVVLGSVSVYDQSEPESGPYPYPTRYADVLVSGRVTDTGELTIGGFAPEGVGIPGDLQIGLSPNAIFALTKGALEESGSSFTVSGGPHSSFSNGGNFADIGGNADFAVPVTGSGSFIVERSKFTAGSLRFERSVSEGQTVNVNGNGRLTLDQPLKFLGSITEDPISSVVLSNATFTSASYSDGVLTILDGSKLVASLRIDSVVGRGFKVDQVGSDIDITAPTGGGSNALQLAQSSMNVPVITQPQTG